MNRKKGKYGYIVMVKKGDEDRMKRLCFSMCICMFMAIFTGCTTTSDANREKVDQKEFVAEEVKEMVIQTKTTQIQIRKAQGNKVQAELLDDQEKSLQLRTHLQQGKLQLQIDGESNRILGAVKENGGPILRVYIPDETLEHVRADTDAGLIQIEKVQVNQMELESKTGAIEVEHWKGNKIQCRTETGKVELEQIDGTFDVKARTGMVDVDVLDGLKQENRIQVETGKVEVGLPANTEARVELSTDLGKIDTDFDIHANAGAKGWIGKNPNASASLSVQTSTGMISLVKK
ncbi:DUF4097 family beta strand repeat-containing protein [Thermoflavimicrobium dichotomicum]|uniref:Putative adhesin n=1 Tax=Thermoflavimicrobium dichotomicum TaxID=46223 RepID=A0A1I3LKB3_9BACL|nr:DUF4097 family beta strand repeat-containing protein [Thermoflavimicrobium dichotomicum]SFI85127.1 Putative adhesin [Thermoflavimicrobium dichotomicum]